VLAEAFEPLPRVSIDYGVMEHAENVAVIEAAFDWSDVGSWEAIGDHLPRDRDANAVEGDFLGIDCHDCIVVAPKGKLVAGVGVEDLIIVDTPDALLVAHRRSEQEVKRVARELMKRGREDLL
jgi:mannose-1-phosphate guanylyltransferase